MSHISVIAEDSDVETVFQLHACQSCDSGCRGDYQSYHCPICPATKFKPTRKPKTLAHLKSHFFGARGNIQLNGYRITSCPQECGEYKGPRGHFHCPFCEKTFTKKPPLQHHVNLCDRPLNRVLERIPPACTVTPLDFASDFRTRDAVVEQDPPALPEVEETRALPEVEETLVTSNPGDTDSLPTEVPTNSIECPHCGKKYHKKYIRAHIRDQHTNKKQADINAGRHHHSAMIDPERGIFSVSKTIRGVQHPIHVTKKTMGPEHIVECEVGECRDLCQTEWRSGNPGFLCDHLKSSEFAHATAPIRLCQEKLKEMTTSGFMSAARQQSCLTLMERATSDKAPSLVQIPQLQHGSDRYSFFSVFTGETRWWCRQQRTVVTIDQKTSSILCRCRNKSCEHRGLVKWYMYQLGRPVPVTDEISSDPEDAPDPDQPSSSHYPPTGSQLDKMMAYVMSKTIPVESLPTFCAETCPKQFIPSETECVDCQVKLSAPILVTRRAQILCIDRQPIVGLESFVKCCPQCGMHYRYQEIQHGVFNFNDSLFLTHTLLLEFRAGLVNHTAINRVVSMLEYRLDISLRRSDIEHAYLAFEAMSDHGYEFFCFRCGHHPKVLIHDLTKKAVFKYAVNDVKAPHQPSPKVNADEFWTNTRKEMIARCFLKGTANPYQMKPSYENWAPFIGEYTRSGPTLFNTEYEKLQPSKQEDHDAVPEEVLTHLLADEKLDTVRRFCRVLGVNSKGSKLDMLCRLRNQSVSKSQFDHAYASLYGHSGGWLSSTCPHNVTYAVKFLLRAESPRDYIDVLRSMKHVPTVNIADIANTIARLGNKVVPGLFTPNEGRLAEGTSENINAAKHGSFQASLPYMLDDRPKKTTRPTQHPVTGSEDRFMLFDWFHQENCHVPVETLRRSTLVKELAGHLNTQAAEQLHRDKARDIYWLNEMSPTNHVFSFRLVTHLKNMAVNGKTLKKQSKVIPNLTLNCLGQLIRSDVPDIPATVDSRPATVSTGNPPTTGQPASASLLATDQYHVLGNMYKRHVVRGDGNCLFRAIGVVVPGQTEDGHLELRQRTFDWCRENQASLDITEDELNDIMTPGTAVGDVALTSLANILSVGIMVVYRTRTSTEHQLFKPRDATTVDVYPVLFDLSGHYDALKTDRSPPTSTRGEDVLTKKKRKATDTRNAKKPRLTPQPFAEMSVTDRRRRILGWLVDQEDVERAMQGEILEENVMETRPECVSACVLDSAVCIADIRPLITPDAWEVVRDTVRQKRLNASWRCPTCKQTIEEGATSLCCDRCLEWFHLNCAGFVRAPRKKTWFCDCCM